MEVAVLFIVAVPLGVDVAVLCTVPVTLDEAMGGGDCVGVSLEAAYDVLIETTVTVVGNVDWDGAASGVTVAVDDAGVAVSTGVAVTRWGRGYSAVR